MYSAKIILFLSLLFAVTASAQDTAQAKSERTEKLINQVRHKLGGKENLESIKSLSLSGKFRNYGKSGESRGDIKIDLLLPDKFMLVELGFPQQMVIVTTTQTINGDQAWFDRKVNRATTDDGAIRPTTDRAQTGTAVPTGTAGMRGTTAGGITTTRTDSPNTTAVNERTVLGMRIPTPEGHERDNELEKMENSRRASAQQRQTDKTVAAANGTDKNTTQEKRLRNEFAALTLVWLVTPPTSSQFNHAETVKSGQNLVEAIEISGDENFAARLFIDQNSLLPAMISYRDFVKLGEGYVVSANPDAESGQVEEISVQFLFSDYRVVKDKNAMLLPFQIVKAVNGTIVSEWKIDRYKINPDLNLKKFEKKR